MKREMGIKDNSERKKVSNTKRIINKHTLYGIPLIYFFEFINVTYAMFLGKSKSVINKLTKLMK